MTQKPTHLQAHLLFYYALSYAKKKSKEPASQHTKTPLDRYNMTKKKERTANIGCYVKHRI
jgi:hypothetical protein